jgi:hypothetical protein
MNNFKKYFLGITILYLVILTIIISFVHEGGFTSPKIYYLLFNLILFSILFIMGSKQGIITFILKMRFANFSRMTISLLPKNKNIFSRLFWGEDLTQDNFMEFYTRTFKTKIIIFIIWFALINLIFFFPWGINLLETNYFYIILIIVGLGSIIPLSRFLFRKMNN